MFYDEIDVQPAVDAAAEMFGTSGRMLDGKNVMRNVALATREFGKIWYGDIDMFDANPNIQFKNLSQRINRTVYVFNNSDVFDYTTATKFSPAT